MDGLYGGVIGRMFIMHGVDLSMKDMCIGGDYLTDTLGVSGWVVLACDERDRVVLLLGRFFSYFFKRKIPGSFLRRGFYRLGLIALDIRNGGVVSSFDFFFFSKTWLVSPERGAVLKILEVAVLLAGG